MRILNHIRALISAVKNRYSEEELDFVGKPVGGELVSLRSSIVAVEAWIERMSSMDATMTKQKK